MRAKRFILLCIASIGLGCLTAPRAAAQWDLILGGIESLIGAIGDKSTPQVVTDPGNKAEIIFNWQKLKESNKMFDEYYTDFKALYDTASRIRRLSATANKIKQCAELLDRIVHTADDFNHYMASEHITPREAVAILSYYQLIREQATDELRYISDLVSSGKDLTMAERLELLDNVYDSLSRIYATSQRFGGSVAGTIAMREGRKTLTKQYCSMYAPSRKSR